MSYACILLACAFAPLAAAVLWHAVSGLITWWCRRQYIRAVAAECRVLTAQIAALDDECRELTSDFGLGWGAER